MIPQDSRPQAFIGTAGWSIPPGFKDQFSTEGPQLVQYGQKLNAVEINSSFYREHKPETYAKWAQSVPDDFLFSVKLLRYFTQEKRLKETGGKLQEVLAGMSELGPKWGVLLVQLPPSLEFVSVDVERFLKSLRKSYQGLLAFEPRHLSWGSERALSTLGNYQVNKVLADPDPVYLRSRQRAAVEKELVYYRLHGAPEIYKSRYSLQMVQRIAARLQKALQSGQQAWCIFDNTTFGHATGNALELKAQIELGEFRGSKGLESKLPNPPTRPRQN